MGWNALLTARRACLVAATAFLVSGLASMTGAMPGGDAGSPHMATAALAAERAEATAATLEARLVAIGGLLERLAAGARPVPDLAVGGFRRFPGLEQLAAYSHDGSMYWALRAPARGRELAPAGPGPATAGAADGKLRLGAPSRPAGVDAYWLPLIYTSERESIVAFLRADDLLPFMARPGDVAALFTGAGRLVDVSSDAGAPIGASFANAPGFRLVSEARADGGAYLGAPDGEDGGGSMVGYRRLACCDAILTVAMTATPRALAAVRRTPAPPPGTWPIGRWFAAAAAGLMVLTAFATLWRRLLAAAPDPWRDFGRRPGEAAKAVAAKRPQPLA